MAYTNDHVVLTQDLEGHPVSASFMQVVTDQFSLPEKLEPGALVLKNLFISLDPYMRWRMNTGAAGYLPPFKLGKTMEAGGVSEVVGGSRDGILTGDKVYAMVGWETFTILPASADVEKIDASVPLPLSYYLGIAGMPGATAYYGLSLANPQPGQTIFVSAAAGAVGHVVGQVAKLKGLRVIGSAGSDEKVALLLSKYGFDAAFNYRKVHGRIHAALREIAPEGLDIYFDNVGSEHLDAALVNMKPHGTVVACGMISQYNGQSYEFKNMPAIVFKKIRVQGFLISDQAKNPEFMQQFRRDIASWLADGRIKYDEQVVLGLHRAPEAFVGLFSGANIGKLVIKV